MSVLSCPNAPKAATPSPAQLVLNAQKTAMNAPKWTSALSTATLPPVTLCVMLVQRIALGALMWIQRCARRIVTGYLRPKQDPKTYRQVVIHALVIASVQRKPALFALTTATLVQKCQSANTTATEL